MISRPSMRFTSYFPMPIERNAMMAAMDANSRVRRILSLVYELYLSAPFSPFRWLTMRSANIHQAPLNWLFLLIMRYRNTGAPKRDRTVPTGRRSPVHRRAMESAQRSNSAPPNSDAGRT